MNPYDNANNSSGQAYGQRARNRETRLRSYVITRIDNAVENGWVRPYYQPVIRSLTGKLCGFEALARWEDPEHGLLSPDVFIPALEDAGLIHLLDIGIVRQVCKQYRDCVNRGEPMVPISFNLSRLDFELCDIFAEVENAAHEFGVPRRMLNVEITESALATNAEYMESIMRKFRNAGYQVWMDDFGSGYSTLNVLKDFDFDELKIDMEFLSRFGEKSKTILASVVDMAKKLGIHTLAEGVETEEHRDYLRRIGCEKMQGYLFGKPLPYGSLDPRTLEETIGFESTAERLYQDEIGIVNTLSLSERDLTANNSTQGYVTSMSLATVEFFDNQFKVVDSNRVFREGLANVGIASVEEAENRINDLSLPLARHARRLAENIREDKYARIDYVTGDIACVMRVKHIATTSGGKIAMLVSIDDTLEQRERRRHDRMDELLSVMYTVYEHVDIIHLDDKYVEPVFDSINLRMQVDTPDFDTLNEQFATAEIYGRDRERFMRFMNFETMMDRLNRSDENFVSSFFRVRQHGGNYSWKMFGLITIGDKPGNQVMLVIRRTHWSHDDLLQAAFEGTAAERQHLLKEADVPITESNLWRALSRGERLRLFWKDVDRRFVGANQAFLDYYGFDSVADIVGKTDEDMGWHINPVPFKNIEERVLEEGVHLEGEPGQCIVHGEVRNIIANKHPVYSNGRIVGLVGYFIDQDDEGRNEEINGLPIHDNVTGVLNYTGLEAATWEYVDAYRKQDIDFAMISINVETFETINAEFGYEFGERVLKRVADELTAVAGHQRVIGHVYADRFVILAQGDSDEVLKTLCNDIEQRLMSIAEIDGKQCTVYALAGFSRFSELGDVEAMKRANRDRRLERRGSWSGSLATKDIITSELL